MDGLPVVDLGPTVLLGLTVLMILTGRLVPKGTVDLMQRALDKRDDQVAELIASLHTSNKLIEAVVRVTGTPEPVAEEEPGSDGL